MKKYLLLVLLFAVFTTNISCSKNDNINIKNIEITGIIQKSEITSYQYGTHTISNYALRSSSVILDNYIDKKVTIIGHKIDGYPIDNGPDFIEVDSVK